MAYRSKVALVYLLGFALDLLNMFVASIAYPDIAQQLHASVTQLAWISNAYVGPDADHSIERVAGDPGWRAALDPRLAAAVRCGLGTGGAGGID
jgi:hypothetical protein